MPEQPMLDFSVRWRRRVEGRAADNAELVDNTELGDNVAFTYAPHLKKTCSRFPDGQFLAVSVHSGKSRIVSDCYFNRLLNRNRNRDESSILGVSHFSSSTSCGMKQAGL